MSSIRIRTTPLGERGLDGALELLRSAHAAEREHSPLLPPVLLGDPMRAEPGLRAVLARGAVGAALLDACVAWARERGFERLMVEHETANLAGSAFWGRHFRPYLTFSMRYAEV